MERVARQPGMAVLVAERHQQNAKVFAMNQIDDAQAILGRVEAEAEAVEAGGNGGQTSGGSRAVKSGAN